VPIEEECASISIWINRGGHNRALVP